MSHTSVNKDVTNITDRLTNSKNIHLSNKKNQCPKQNKKGCMGRHMEVRSHLLKIPGLIIIDESVTITVKYQRYFTL